MSDYERILATLDETYPHQAWHLVSTLRHAVSYIHENQWRVMTDDTKPPRDIMRELAEKLGV